MGNDEMLVRASERYLSVTNIRTTWMPAVLLCLLILSGFVDIPLYRRNIRTEPSWPAEIALWKSNAGTPLQVAPFYYTHALVIGHQHPERSDLPSYIYDSIEVRPSQLRSFPVSGAPSTPHIAPE